MVDNRPNFSPPAEFTIGGITFNLRLILLVVYTTTIPLLDLYRYRANDLAAFTTPLFVTAGVAAIVWFATRRRWIIFIALLALTCAAFASLELASITPYNRFVAYFLIPALIIVFLFGDQLSDYGIQLGNWREGLLWTVAVCGVLFVILYFFARLPSMRAYYTNRAPDSSWLVIWYNGVDLFGWEFVWRGFLLFGLARIIGPGAAIWLQAVPFAFMHYGKPEVETFTTIFGGAGFAFIAWRTQSMLYGWLIHWGIAVVTTLVAVAA